MRLARIECLTYGIAWVLGSLLLQGVPMHARTHVMTESHRPKVERFRCDNGLDVAMMRYGVVPRTSIQLVISTRDRGARGRDTHVAEILADYLKDGTDVITGQPLLRALTLDGGSISSKISPGQIELSYTFLTENAPQGIAILAATVTAARVSESAVEHYIREHTRRLALDKAKAQSLGLEGFWTEVSVTVPPGEAMLNEPDLRPITVEDVSSSYERHVVASNCRLYITGVYDVSVRRLIQERFASWRPGVPVQRAQVSMSKRKALRIIDRPLVSQALVIVGTPVVDLHYSDVEALELANALLGGSTGSRISYNLRESRGLTYSVRSRLEIREGGSAWTTQTEVLPRDCQTAIDEILREVGRLRDEPIPIRDLEDGKTQLAGAFLNRMSTRLGLITLLSVSDTYGMGTGYMSRYLVRLRKMQSRDVQQVVKKYLDPDKMIVVIVGDKRQLQRSY